MRAGPHKTIWEPTKDLMYPAAQTKRSRFAKPLVMGLAILSLVFFLQIAAHGHSDARPDGACRVCQIAHIGVAPAVTAVTLSAPLVAVGQVTTEVFEAETEDSSSHSSSRAPPSSNA